MLGKQGTTVRAGVFTVSAASDTVGAGAWSRSKIITVIGTGLLFVSIIVAVPGNCVLDMGYSIPLRVRALAFPFLLM